MRRAPAVAMRVTTAARRSTPTPRIGVRAPRGERLRQPPRGRLDVVARRRAARSRRARTAPAECRRSRRAGRPTSSARIVSGWCVAALRSRIAHATMSSPIGAQRDRRRLAPRRRRELREVLRRHRHRRRHRDHRGAVLRRRAATRRRSRRAAPLPRAGSRRTSRRPARRAAPRSGARARASRNRARCAASCAANVARASRGVLRSPPITVAPPRARRPSCHRRRPRVTLRR